MKVFLFIALFFLLMGICGIVYLTVKIKHSVKYFASRLSKKKRLLVTLSVIALMLLPAFLSFVKWFIVIMHFIVFLAITDAVVFAVKKLGWDKKARQIKWLKIAYHSGAFALLLTVIVSCYAKYNMYHIVRTDYDVIVNKKLSQEFTVVMLADLHYGISLDAQQLQTVADAIQKEAPDAVLLCGDIVDESSTAEGMKEALSILGSIETRFGVYYIYGNHDKSRFRFASNFTERELAETIDASGITVLEDHCVTFNDDILLVGRADRTNSNGNRMSIDTLLEGYDKSMTILVADHQPSEYAALRKAGCDLVVSGHTHGGQTFPLGFFNDMIRFSDLNYGFANQGSLNAVVTSGIAGWGYDMRTEHHSEYVVIHIKGRNQ